MLSIKSHHNPLKMNVATNVATKSPLFTKPAFALLVLAVGIYVGMRLWHITAYSLWGGEAFAIYGARQDWRSMIAYVVEDVVHPPLFYGLLKIWMAIGGESLLWLKLFPVLTAIATIVPFLLLCEELKLQTSETALALTLVAVNGYLIHYAQEVRMYSLFMFLGVCSFWLFVRFFNAKLDTQRDLLALFMVNLLLVYTHYFGWLVVGLEFLFLLLWERRKLLSFLLSVTVLILFFSPWAYTVAQVARNKGGLDINLDWIPRPSRYNLQEFYAILNGPFDFRGSTYLRLLFFGSPVLLWGWHTIRGSQEDRRYGFTFWWLFLFPLLPIVLVFFLSRYLLSHSVWIDRYFIFIAVPYMILIAMAVHRIRPKWVRTIMVLSIVVWSTLAGIRDLSANRLAWENPRLGTRMTWETLVRQMIQAEPSQTGDIKVYALTVISKGRRTGDWAIIESMRYYLDLLHEKRFQVVYMRDVFTLLSAVEEDHFWVASFELSPLKENPPQRILMDNGYRVGESFQFEEYNNRLLLFPVWRQ